ncbi:MAG: DUF924 family protein [Gammaproteobacteria bacterium]
MLRTPAEVLDTWFAGDVGDASAMQARIAKLFTVDPAFDEELRGAYAPLVEQALAGALDDWIGECRSALALVILLDQLPRNLFRGSARAFAGDARAQRVALHAFAAGFDRALAPIEQVFFYMPFEHAEDMHLQERCVAGYEALRRSATPEFVTLMDEVVAAGHAHRAVVARFGRFPHRNDALGRASTVAERAWLAENRHGWGQGAADLELCQASARQ